MLEVHLLLFQNFAKVGSSLVVILVIKIIEDIDKYHRLNQQLFLFLEP